MRPRRHRANPTRVGKSAGIQKQQFQSAPLLRGATRTPRGCRHGSPVSIRAPLARGDIMTDEVKLRKCRFNPRPSCEGRRRTLGVMRPEHLFQSAPLLRGATGAGSTCERNDGVSIRAPLARGDQASPTDARRAPCFNPRPSCEGRPTSIPLVPMSSSFQSAPLLRGATGRRRA